MEDPMKHTLERLRRKFGISEGSGLRAREDTAAALEARHGINPERYRDSPWYRRQVDTLVPAYARAAGKEPHNAAGTDNTNG